EDVEKTCGDMGKLSELSDWTIFDRIREGGEHNILLLPELREIERRYFELRMISERNSLAEEKHAVERAEWQRKEDESKLRANEHFFRLRFTEISRLHKEEREIFTSEPARFAGVDWYV
ncbi:hypothetical protein PFISCL1PPCAC_11114, partial [Pristionchus fissidentatus]